MLWSMALHFDPADALITSSGLASRTPRQRYARRARSALLVIVALAGSASVSCAGGRGAPPPPAVAVVATDTASLPIPAPTGFVNDFAHVLAPADVAALDTLVREVRGKCHGEIAVVTLPSLQGRQIRDVATRIGNTWGVGYRGAPNDPATNTGVVILLAPNDRRVWIGTAEGARAFIPDREATAISEIMKPDFEKGAYGAGLRNGVRLVALAFAVRFHFTLTADSVGPVGR